MTRQHTNGQWKFKLLWPNGQDNKLLKARQQPKHKKNGMDDDNNTNTINRFTITNNEIGSRYSANPHTTNDPTTHPTLEQTYEVYDINIYPKTQQASMLFVITYVYVLFLLLIWAYILALMYRTITALLVSMLCGVWLSILFIRWNGLNSVFLSSLQYSYLFEYDTIGDIMYCSGYVLGVIDGISCLNTENNECELCDIMQWY